jgi:hypothetical protein
MIRNVTEKYDGYHGEYVDARGNVEKVRGTYALGVPLSWYDAQGNYVVICGHDQGRLVAITESIIDLAGKMPVEIQKQLK